MYIIIYICILYINFRFYRPFAGPIECAAFSFAHVKSSANRPGVFPPGISWPQYWAPYVVAIHSNMPQLALYGFLQNALLDSTSMLMDSAISHLQRCGTNSAA